MDRGGTFLGSFLKRVKGIVAKCFGIGMLGLPTGYDDAFVRVFLTLHLLFNLFGDFLVLTSFVVVNFFLFFMIFSGFLHLFWANLV